MITSAILPTSVGRVEMAESRRTEHLHTRVASRPTGYSYYTVLPQNYDEETLKRFAVRIGGKLGSSMDVPVKVSECLSLGATLQMSRGELDQSKRYMYVHTFSTQRIAEVFYYPTCAVKALFCKR